MVLSTVTFFVMALLLGVPVVQLATGRLRLRFETWLLAAGVGLAVFAVLTPLLNGLSLPLTWWMFLVAGAVLLGLAVLRRRLWPAPPPEPAADAPSRRTEVICLLVAVGMAGVVFCFYLSGTFSVPWLPDDDSWWHAAAGKYIAVNGTYTVEPARRAYPVESYLEPYPPSYPALMGVLHQTNRSIHNTLKLFNVLIIALGIVWAYQMMRLWTGRPSTALWMTGALTVMPCFMSHFIWAQSLALVLFFPALYAMERTRRETSWWAVSAVCIAGLFLTQPSSAAIFGMLAALTWLVNLGFTVFARRHRFAVKALAAQALAAVAGLLIAGTFYLAQYRKFGKEDFIWGVMKRIPGTGVTLQVTGTSGGRVYTLWNFIWAPAVANPINQPTGLGVVMFLAACGGVVLLLVRARALGEERWRLTALLWMLFTVLGTEGNALPVNLFPHRFWAFLAIPAAMLAGAFLAFLASKLTWRSAALCAGFGVAFGLALTFGTVTERLYETFGDASERIINPEKTLALRELRLGLFLIALLAAAGTLAAGIASLVKKAATPGMYVCFSLLGILVAGIMVTSAWPKVKFETLRPWMYSGVFFYRENFIEVRVNGRIHRFPEADITGPTPKVPREVLANLKYARKIPDPQHVRGFVQLRRQLPPDTRVFAATGLDAHIVGFDLYTPLYDEELQTFREKLRHTNVADVDETVVRHIHEIAVRRDFEYVLLSPYWSAVLHYHQGGRGRQLRPIARKLGLSALRMAQLCPYPKGDARPTLHEINFLRHIRDAVYRIETDPARRAEHQQELDALMKKYDLSPTRFGEIFLPGAEPTEAERPHVAALRRVVGYMLDHETGMYKNLEKIQKLRKMMQADRERFVTVIASPSEIFGISLFRVVAPAP